MMISGAVWLWRAARSGGLRRDGGGAAVPAGRIGGLARR